MPVEPSVIQSPTLLRTQPRHIVQLIYSMGDKMKLIPEGSGLPVQLYANRSQSFA